MSRIVSIIYGVILLSLTAGEQLPTNEIASINLSTTTNATVENLNHTTIPLIDDTNSVSMNEENDYNFVGDRLNELPEYEYANLNEDANPLHFLKQNPSAGKHQERHQSTPIYITIPIYINTGGLRPISLTIGAQDHSPLQQRRIPVGTLQKDSQTKAPNSHFNRLLHEIEPSKKRQTNRHRSSTRTKIYARKDRNSTAFYKESSPSSSGH